MLRIVTLQELERLTKLVLRWRGGNGQAVKGLLVGCAVVVISALNGLFDLGCHRALRIALGQHLDQAIERSLVAAIEHALDGLHPHRGFAYGIDRAPAWGQVQFEAKGSRDLSIKTVECTDSKAMQLFGRATQGCEAIGLVKWQIRYGLLEQRERWSIDAGHGQTDQNSLQDFTGSFAGKGRCQNVFNALAGENDLKESIAELVRLTSSCRGANHQRQQGGATEVR